MGYLPQMGSLCWVCIGLVLWVCWLIFTIQIFFLFSLNLLLSNHFISLLYYNDLFNSFDFLFCCSENSFLYKMNY